MSHSVEIDRDDAQAIVDLIQDGAELDALLKANREDEAFYTRFREALHLLADQLTDEQVLVLIIYAGITTRGGLF